MNEREKQKYVMSIISGITYISINGEAYISKEADLLSKHIAEEMYDKKLEEALSKGILSDEEINKQLISMDMWSEAEDKILEDMPKVIEELKFQLYGAYKTFRSRDPIRKQLDKQKERFSELIQKKSALKGQSAESLAETSKYRYLVCSNVTDIRGNKLWESDQSLQQDSYLSDQIVQSTLNSTPTETQIREISRTEPWRSFWTTGKSEGGVFGCASRYLTNNQKSAIAWSRVYDNIQESPDCPPDEIIDDDDMLDGFLIHQSRKREQQMKEKSSSEKSSGVKGDEVFLMAGTAADAQRIYAMNNADSKKIVRHRQKQIKDADKQGLDASKTIDAQLEMRQQTIEQFKSHSRR